jgi:anaphase-promoting complex subunit 3
VVFQLAKAYRLVGDEVKFTRLLAVARDISPKSMDKIKKLLETVEGGGGNSSTHGDVRMDEG